MKLFYFFIFSTLLFSCRNSLKGSGNIIEQSRAIIPFKTLSVSGPIKVDFKIGITPSITVEADDNIMKYVVTEVKQNELKINLKGLNNLRNATVRIHIVSASIESIASSASAQVRSEETLMQKGKITMSASSGSMINIKADAPTIVVKASSGSEIIVSGRTKNVEAKSSSGSTLNLNDLSAENVQASASSGASISCFASVSINVSASSGGNIKYRGNGAVVKNVSSGGSINPN